MDEIWIKLDSLNGLIEIYEGEELVDKNDIGTITSSALPVLVQDKVSEHYDRHVSVITLPRSDSRSVIRKMLGSLIMIEIGV